MQQPDVQDKAGFSKILNCCEQAKKDGIDWVWVDTCCIDKTSSSELSEAINSMFEWYQKSAVCYAFLEDVHATDCAVSTLELRQARWFTRGWCLQELVAPRKIEFYSADWTEFGTKWSLHTQIEQITGIPAEILLNKSENLGLVEYNVAQKMSWASKRKTTRREDEAYCLLGIFGIFMPLLYGEGSRAFHRLQEAIMKQTEDYSLFLWTESRKVRKLLGKHCGVFAPSPSSFCEGSLQNSGKIYHYRDISSVFLNRGLALKILPRSSASWNPSRMTPRGLYIHTFGRSSGNKIQLWTGCMYGEEYLCVEIQVIRGGGFSQYGRAGITANSKWFVDAREAQYFELSEFYLNTDERSYESWGLLRPLYSSPKVVMSTKCKESIYYISAFPPTIAEETGSCVQGQQVYSLKGREEISRSSFSTLSLRFKVFQAFGIGTGHFIVSFGLLDSSPWCSLAVNTGTDMLSLEEELSNMKSPKNGISDRAMARLPSGRVIHVAAKGTSGKENPVGNPCYTLYVTLLAGDADGGANSPQ